MYRTRWMAVALAWILSTSVSLADEPVDFGKQILPLLKKNCVACHHKKEAESGVNLETHSALLKGGDEGVIIVPGKPQESKLIGLLTGEREPVMPPEDNKVDAKSFTPAEIELVRKWIEQGAKGSDAVTANGPTWSKLPAKLQPSYAMSSTDDGQFLAVGRGNQVRVYEWPSWQREQVNPELLQDESIRNILGNDSQPAAHLDLVQSLAASPDGSRIASGGYREVKLWSRIPSWMEAAQDNFGSIECSTLAGNWLIVARKNQTLEIYEDGPLKKIGSQPHNLGSIRSIAVSPNRSKIAIASDSGLISIGQLQSNGTITFSAIDRFPAKLQSLFLLDDGHIGGITSDGALRLWTTIPNASQPDGPPAPIQTVISSIPSLPKLREAILFGDDAKRLVTASEDGSIHILQLPTAQILKTLQHGGGLRQVLVSPDRKSLLSIGVSGLCKVWDIDKGEVKATTTLDHSAHIAQRRLQSDIARQKAKVAKLEGRLPELEKAKTGEVEAKTKLQATKDKAVETLTAKTTDVEKAMAAHSEAEKAVAAAKAAIEEAMKKLEAAEKDVVAKKEAIAKAETAKADAAKEVTKQEQILATAEESVQKATAAIPTLQAEIEQEKNSLTSIQTRHDQTVANPQPLPDVVVSFWSRDSKRIFSVHQDRLLRSIQLDALKPEVPQRLPDSFVTSSKSIAMEDAGGGLWFLVDDQRPVGVRTVGKWKLERTIGGAEDSTFSDRITSLDFSNDGTQLLVGSGQPSRFGDLKVLEVASGKVLRDFGEIHSDSILAAKFSPDGQSIATAGADKIIRILNLEGKVQKTLEGHTHHVLAIAWSQDGQSLASGSADASVKVWDVAAGTQLRTIAGFGKEITSIRYLGQTQQILTCGVDKIVRLHDASNGKLIRAYDASADSLYTATSFQEDGYVAASGQDGTITLWKLDAPKPLRQLP